MTNRKNDIKYHEVLKQASMYIYKRDSKQLPAGYKVIDHSKNKNNNGFYAEALSNGKDIIIVYKGTDIGSLQDIKNDLAMAHSDIPRQASDAIAFYDKIAEKYGAKNITITGHSLGGSLGEITSAIRGVLAVTFNAYGVRDMFKSGTKLNENNVINYVNEKDGITMVNGENHIGEIYSIPNLGRNKVECHFIEGMGDLSERIEKTPVEIQKIAKNEHSFFLKHRTIISNTIESRNKIRNLIKEDIRQMQDRHSEFRHALNHNPTSQCAGSYSVKGYTRADGTKVNDYIRTCGAKHEN